MQRFRVCFSVFCLTLLAVGIPSLQAFWVDNGVAICTAVEYQQFPEIISDGGGGAIIVWYDRRTMMGHDVYAQKINAAGVVQWNADGVPVSLETTSPQYPQLTSDGSGGAIIAWQDWRDGSYDVYAQRITASGLAQWQENGVPICVETGNQQDVMIVSDGAGGAIIAWEDGFSGEDNIYAQRINAGGTVLWATSGNPICLYAGHQRNLLMVLDGAGGAIIVWEDERNLNTEIYVQRVSADGYLLWDPDGVPVCTETGSKTLGDAVQDGNGGIIIAWSEYRGSSSDIYIQRINASGIVGWTVNGEAICAQTSDQRSPKIIADGGGGAFICWSDERSGAIEDDIYAQKVDASGNVEWQINGIPICTANGNQAGSRITSDELGGAIITWYDRRNSSHYDIYSQRIDAGGGALWPAEGIAICTAVEDQINIEVTADGRGGAILTWADERNSSTSYDLYAQQLNRNGLVGYMSPVIHSAEDVPDDQGGWINIAWDASRSDPYGHEITEYTIWRALSTPAAALRLSSGAVLLSSVAEIDDAVDRPVIRMQVLSGQTYYWELIDSHPAYFLEGYSKIVATAFDSCLVATNYHYFQIIAHTQVPTTFFISEPDSGYSVDNIAPCPPLYLAGEQSYSPEGLKITWPPNSETDLDGYNIYRGTDPAFIPGPGNLISSQSDALYFDYDWRWNNTFCYKVAAVDVNNNESEYVLLSSGNVTGDDPATMPQATFLEQNYPNPFNPITRITFGLDSLTHVSLCVYDVSGRLVRVLVDTERPSGTYEMMWDGKDDRGLSVASGIYFYRLVADDFVQMKKMALLR